MEECSGWGMDCLSQTEVDDTDEVDGNEAAGVDAAGGGGHQTTTEAASHDKADAHLTDDGTNHHPTTDDGILLVGDTGTVTAEADTQRPFILAIPAMALAGMGMVTFTALAFGKSGLYFGGYCITVLVNHGTLDIAMITINAPETQATGPTQPDVRSLSTRALCWLSIGILQGTCNARWSVTFDQKRAGTVWQIEPMLYDFVACFTFFFLIGGVMLQAHMDRRPTIMVWWGFLLACNWLSYFGDYSPYPELSALGSGLKLLQLFVGTVGVYFVVMHIDKKAERCDVRRGYQLLVGSSPIQFTVLIITSLKSALGAFGVSGALMIFQMICLKVFVPVGKRCFGDDQRKLWTYAVPACMLALELGPCLLLLGEDFTTFKFWALLTWQELNSVAKNTGKYAELYVGVRALVRRPVDEEVVQLMEEKRQTIAPCDNIGEIASPIVILVAMMLEGLFDMLPIERAPHLADANEGILGAWRSRQFRGEGPIMMIIVLAVRLIFCWIELRVERMQRRNDGTDNSTTSAEVGIEDVRSDEERAVGATKSRRSSMMAVLYNRIVRSEEAPVEMKYMAGATFALQAVIFVYNAASIGKRIQ